MKAVLFLTDFSFIVGIRTTFNRDKITNEELKKAVYLFDSVLMNVAEEQKHLLDNYLHRSLEPKSVEVNLQYLNITDCLHICTSFWELVHEYDENKWRDTKSRISAFFKGDNKPGISVEMTNDQILVHLRVDLADIRDKTTSAINKDFEAKQTTPTTQTSFR